MLSWFKKKLVSVQDIPPEQVPGAQAEGVAPVVALSEQEENEPKFFLRLKEGLSRTRKTFVRQIDALFLGKRKIDAELLEDLEEILIMADIGANTTQELLDKTREQVRRNELGDGQALKKALKEMILGYLLNADRPADLALPQQGPFVVMVLGVNGVGKTTTIGKLAHKFTQAGQKVLLVAADTFRAAASEQLQVWGKRVGVEVVAQQAGADPSSVVYDALDYARPRNFDVVLVDTAGRLHTKVNLMEELKKIKRVMDKKIPGAPHEILLVLDATTGQNAISQARLFNEAVDVTGLALTKLDGTAKGGIVINICHEFNIPIRFIGIGEQMEDLRDFEPNDFVEALFAEGEA
ncbi:MAG: signal recognition particle-docking protein FtsY [Desulfobulbaceae bacterium]|nr:signal recognition particle-docking protein FtsY [Desulfobulbaceae bacterium]HIJ91073.1 signal recognition particle-docking protein FtsY [Deltaproteobacteria bacterium]